MNKLELKFKKLKKLMHVRMKAHAEAEASKNPTKFMEKMKEPSIKNAKGIPF